MIFEVCPHSEFYFNDAHAYNTSLRFLITAAVAILIEIVRFLFVDAMHEVKTLQSFEY